VQLRIWQGCRYGFLRTCQCRIYFQQCTTDSMSLQQSGRHSRSSPAPPSASTLPANVNVVDDIASSSINCKPNNAMQVLELRRQEAGTGPCGHQQAPGPAGLASSPKCCSPKQRSSALQPEFWKHANGEFQIRMLAAVYDAFGRIPHQTLLISFAKVSAYNQTMQVCPSQGAYKYHSMPTET